MTDSNLVRYALVKEATPGTTPANPVMQKMRVTSITQNEQNQTVRSEQLRSDRLSEAEILVGRSLADGFNFEFSNGHFDDLLVASMLSTRQRVAYKFNDGTADNVITDVVAATDHYVVDSAAAFKVGHVIKTSGFTNAANNGTHLVSAVTGTTIVVGASSLTNETTPPGTAKIQTIGFQGASGDIVADATGLTSTLLDFTTLGLAVGQLIKISAESGLGFATAANNTFARISSIAANDLNLDHLPTGWTADVGTSKTIRVYVADYVRVGTTLTGNTFSSETAFLGQSVPTYMVDTKLAVNQFNLSAPTRSRLTGSVGFLRGGDTNVSTSAISGATYTAEPTDTIYNTTSNLSRIAEGGVTIGSPNYVSSMDFNVNNNLREILALGSLNAVDLGKGEATITGNLVTYFGSKALYDKARALTNSSLMTVFTQSTKAYGFYFPTVQFSAPRPNAQGKNQDVFLNASFNSSANSALATNFQIDMFEQIDA